jgi:formate dehydrogenase subunit delta
MQSANLVRMANQITDFFELYPKAEALDGIAKQVHNTWDPRMRDELKNIVEAGGDGLNPLCMEALQDYFQGPNSPGRRSTVNPRDPSPHGAQPSFADGGGDAG